MTIAGFIPIAVFLKKIGLLQRIIWDQHELPPDSFLNSPVKMKVLGVLMSWCDVVISANTERRDLLLKLWRSGDNRSIKIIENFPSLAVSKLSQKTCPATLQKWLDGSPYFLSSGGGDADRRLDECVEAIMQTDKLKLVVVGRFREEERARLEEQWGDPFLKQVYFTGWVPQNEMVRYVDNALASLILYGRNTKWSNNSWFCAPNRLYQAISRGCPVITGNNPPLSHFIQKTGAGLSLNSDGSDPKDIAEKMNRIFVENDVFKKAAKANQTRFVWENQEPVLADILGE